MEFTTTPARAMTWPSLAAAAREIERLWEFGPAHELRFSRKGPARAWVCQVVVAGDVRGYVAPFVIRVGEPRFQ